MVAREDEQLVVPDTALVLRNDQTVLFKVAESGSTVAEQVVIAAGKKSAGYTAVNGEITESDAIVILGNAFLEDGQAVTVVERR